MAIRVGQHSPAEPESGALGNGGAGLEASGEASTSKPVGLRRAATEAANGGFEWLAEHPRVGAVPEAKRKHVRKVGSVHYDNWTGLGQTPNNTEMGFNPIAYKGFCVMMRPSQFLSVVRPLDEERKPGQLEAFRAALTERENPVGLASPMLYLDAYNLIDTPEKEGYAKVKGHEGRHRAKVMQMINGDVPTPVQVWVGDMYSVKDLGVLFCRLAEGLLPESGGRVIRAPFDGLVDDFPVDKLHESRPWR